MLSNIFRFAISHQREYLADACFIDHPLEKDGKLTFTSLFATHPPIEERISILRNF